MKTTWHLFQFHKMKYLIFISIILQSCFSYSQKWDHIYGNPGFTESFGECIETYDHGYLLSNSYELTGSNWLVKTDINGIIKWGKNIFWDKGNIGRSDIIQDTEGNIITTASVFLALHKAVLSHWILVILLLVSKFLLHPNTIHI